MDDISQEMATITRGSLRPDVRDPISISPRLDHIDAQLAAGEPSASLTQLRNICKICCGDWHGLPANDGCPGAFATPNQERAYWDIRNGRRGPSRREQ